MPHTHTRHTAMSAVAAVTEAATAAAAPAADPDGPLQEAPSEQGIAPEPVPWPRRPHEKWPDTRSEDEFECHACKAYKGSHFFSMLHHFTQGQTLPRHLEEHRAIKCRWACDNCVMDMAVQHGLYVQK